MGLECLVEWAYLKKVDLNLNIIEFVFRCIEMSLLMPRVIKCSLCCYICRYGPTSDVTKVRPV